MTILGGVSFIATVIVGVRTGLKRRDKDEPDPGLRIAAATLMDNHSMIMLTEALKENTEAHYRHRDELRENSHQMERLRDKL